MQYSNCGSVPAAYASPDRTHSRTSSIRTLVRSFKIETLTSAREIDAADANLQPQKSLLAFTMTMFRAAAPQWTALFILYYVGTCCSFTALSKFHISRAPTSLFSTPPRQPRRNLKKVRPARCHVLLLFQHVIFTLLFRDDAINEEVKCSQPFLPSSFRGIPQSRDRSCRASPKKPEKITGSMTRTLRSPFNENRQSRIERCVKVCLM